MKENFLLNLTKKDVETMTFPIREILENSCYYPSCNVDGGVIKDCNLNQKKLNILSFVYCDYGLGKENLDMALYSFKRYHIFAKREVDMQELIPNGWTPIVPPNVSYKEYTRNLSFLEKPFCTWILFERDEQYSAEHGPKRFSLLYIGGEAVATYQALYCSNHLAPKILAIIQPGHGFGLNWTNFFEKNGPLHWTITHNNNLMPQVLYIGGYGHGDDWKYYKEKFDWNGYVPTRNFDYFDEGMRHCVIVFEREK